MEPFAINLSASTCKINLAEQVYRACTIIRTKNIIINEFLIFEFDPDLYRILDLKIIQLLPHAAINHPDHYNCYNACFSWRLSQPQSWMT
jgi:hypothetical protein